MTKAPKIYINPCCVMLSAIQRKRNVNAVARLWTDPSPLRKNRRRGFCDSPSLRRVWEWLWINLQKSTLRRPKFLWLTLWLVSYLFFSFQISYFRKWIITSIREANIWELHVSTPYEFQCSLLPALLILVVQRKVARILEQNRALNFQDSVYYDSCVFWLPSNVFFSVYTLCDQITCLIYAF